MSNYFKAGQKLRAIREGGTFSKDYKPGDVFVAAQDGQLNGLVAVDFEDCPRQKFYAGNFELLIEVSPEVKEGDRVRVVKANGLPHHIYKVGDEGTIKKHSKGGRHLVQFDKPCYQDGLWYITEGDVEVIPSDPVEIARANLEKAKAEFAAAEKAKAEAAKFTEADLKNLMVVESQDESGGLRMVVLTDKFAYWFNTKGIQTNIVGREGAVSKLNFLYKKTAKTLKDFA